MKKRALPVLLVLATLIVCAAIAGCGVAVRVQQPDGRASVRHVHGSAEAAARRASNEIPCALENLVLQDMQGGGYRIGGCGVSVTYTCVGTICVPSAREGSMGSSGASATSPAASGRASRPRDTWSDDQVRQLVAALQQPIGACLPEGTDAIRLQLGISARGQLRRVGQSRFAPELAACIDRALASAQMPGSVGESRSVVLQFRRGATAAEPEATAPADGTPPASALTPEAAARGAIDTRAAAILECVQADALSMQVSWSSAGQLDALLRGDRQGTPDEGCVRAIVQQLTIPAPGATGTIVHAIQRAP
jgi:hypothetical protein